MPQICPRCRHSNPDAAVYCYFDGVVLRSAGGADPNRLGAEFYFPSGRCCRTFDQLALGCQEEWDEARDLLHQGRFQEYFSSWGRLDLARTAQEAAKLPDLDMGLSNLLTALPGASAVAAKLDINPRRLTLGRVLAGDQRKIFVKVANVGKGILQGTLKISEGDKWLRINRSENNGQIAIKTPRDQEVPLVVDTQGLAAGQTYGARLTVITNGGVVEVPVKLELTAQPFPRSPFQTARTPRELAEKMRADPKRAAPLLENGEVARWFAANGWNYPVSGTPAQGVAGVQQFFEALGLSKPPPLQLSQAGVRLTCAVPEAPQAQVSLQTTARKWVYANITTEQPWLEVLTPTIAGAQQAAISFTINPRQLPKAKSADGSLQIVANGGQKLNLRVRVDILRPTTSGLLRLLRPIITLALLLGVFRFLMIPVADFFARGTALQVATKYATSIVPEDTAPAWSGGAWLQLPWWGILLGSNVQMPLGFFGDNPQQQLNQPEFRFWYISTVIREFVLWLWWLGSVGLAWLVVHQGGKWSDVPWAIIAGAALGAVVAATAGCLLLLGDMVPHLLWYTFLGAGAPILIPVWGLLAVLWWVVLGGLLGGGLLLLGPVGGIVLVPLQDTLAWVCRRCGFKPAAAFFTASEG